MSKKRTSAESSNDDQTTEDSDAVFRQVDNVKRGKLASVSDTTIQDLPIEMLECILVKAIAMEVKNMKLAKSVWKEKADLVISRLRTVCSNWSGILTTNFFRNELHRALDGIAQETIRMEILQESLVHHFVLKVNTMKDDILMFCLRHVRDNLTSAVSSSSNIQVYDRNNMEKVKDVIALPGMRTGDIAACNVTNCVYVGLLDENRELLGFSVLRITRDEEHKFNIHTWISNLRLSISFISLSVSDKGNLIIISSLEGQGSHAVSVYTPNGFLQHEVMLSPDIDGFTYYIGGVIQKSNGNLVLAFVAVVSGQHQTVLKEIDTDGIVQRQYKSSLTKSSLMNCADTFGRILIHDVENRIELLDSEFNLLDFTGPQPDQYDYDMSDCLHYNSERNEVMGICDVDADINLLRIFRFREE